MPYKWQRFSIRRFFGLDEKTNVVDVKDGYSLDLNNVFQDANGVVSKCKGSQIMFQSDLNTGVPIDEVGTCVLSGQQYYFQFSGGDFYYSTTLTGSFTGAPGGTISPTPAISTVNQIWWVVLDDKLFFVDGTNVLRFFDGSNIFDSFVAVRPTATPTTVTAGAGYDYSFTIDRTLNTPSALYAAESPLSSGRLINKAANIDIKIPLNVGPGGQNFVTGDIIRVYRKSTNTAIGWVLTDEHTVIAGDVVATFVQIVVTGTPTEDSAQLYTDLGLAINKSAPTALVGITQHYGRLIGWDNDTVRCSKVTNPQAWPDEQTVHESFVYSFAFGDGDQITVCVSYRESLFVLKSTIGSIFVGVGPDDSGNNPFSFRRYDMKGNGCIAGKSAVVIGEAERLYLIYLSTNGFFATNGNEPLPIGEPVEPSVRAYNLSQKQSAVAVHERAIGQYMCFMGPPEARKCYVLDVRKDINGLVGWFKFDAFPVKCISWDSTSYLAGTYDGYSTYSRNEDDSSDFAKVRIEYVLAASVNTGTNEITVVKSYQTADLVNFRTSGTMPAPLTINGVYYVIRVSATQIKLATSAVNALAGTAIDITTTGTNTHSIVSSEAIDAYYTTNWMNFKTPAHVKKLGKPLFIFDANISAVNIELSIAYDWYKYFVQAGTITIASTHFWGVGVWGGFIWGDGALASPKNVAIPRRKVRSVRYKFRNATINQDLNIQGFEQEFAYIRNRGNFVE